MKNEELKNELLRIAESRGGELVPAAVVECAADPESVLHPFFEWDDSEAAAAWRLTQAAQLIRRVKVEVVSRGKQEVKVRAFVNVQVEVDEDDEEDVVPKRGPNPGIYVSLEAAMSRQDWREQMMDRAKRDMKIFKDRYSVLNRLAPVFAAMEEVGS